MFGFSFTSWFRSVSQRKSPPIKTARPWIDVLEDRSVPSVAPTGTGVISGHAFVDVSGNGLSGDDVAQKGVVVGVYKEGPHGGYLGFTATNAAGEFSFNHLAAGKYHVFELTPRGFVETGPTVGSSYTINLVNGQTSSANDFDNFKRVTDGRLSKVTYTVIHDGVAKTFSSLAGHTHAGDTVTVNFTVTKSPPVTLSLASYNATGKSINLKTLNQDTLADSQTGTFGPGAHRLTVVIPNDFYQIYFVRGPVIDHFGPARSNITYWDQCRFIAGDAGGAAVVQVQPSTISGHVVNDLDHDGTINAGDMGIGGVLVTLTGKNDLGQTVNMSMGTDANGNYSFTGLHPGTYAVSQTVPDTFSAEADFLGSLNGNASSLTTIDQIVVTGGQTGSNYDFLDQASAVNLPGSISGTVTEQDFGGAAFTPTSGATVRLTDSSGNIVGSTTTDTFGNYSFTGVATGAGTTYSVVFVNPGSSQFMAAPAVSVDMSVSGEVVTGVNGAFRNRAG